jgi:membrane dipeptidase
MLTGMIPIFDGHNDTLLQLYLNPERDPLTESAEGHIDLPRARRGGLAGGLFAIFPPGDLSIEAMEAAAVERDGVRTKPPFGPLDSDVALRATLAMTARLHRLVDEAHGEVALVSDAATLERCLEDGTFAAVLHLEGAEAIDPELHALEVLYRAGLRSLGPVWSRPNAFATGVPFSFPGSPESGPGLTLAGRALVQRCNELGVMIDLSHLNARGFWEVAERSDAPLVATHSNAHALCASPRNLTDDQLEAIRASEGMVGLNFAVTFLREDGRRDPDTPLEVAVRHIDHLVERVGIDGVGFGSDFDGALVPEAIGDAAGLPKLMAALEEHGYNEAARRKLAHGNWLRVLQRSWRS